jgi:hypothetical protein
MKSDLDRLDRMKDAEIDYSDIPALGKEFLKKATVPWPPAKQQLTIRLDKDTAREMPCNASLPRYLTTEWQTYSFQSVLSKIAYRGHLSSKFETF